MLVVLCYFCNRRINKESGIEEAKSRMEEIRNREVLIVPCVFGMDGVSLLPINFTVSQHPHNKLHLGSKTNGSEERCNTSLASDQCFG